MGQLILLKWLLLNVTLFHFKYSQNYFQLIIEKKSSSENYFVFHLNPRPLGPPRAAQHTELLLAALHQQNIQQQNIARPI